MSSMNGDLVNLSNLGVAFMEKKEFEKAIDVFNKAISIPIRLKIDVIFNSAKQSANTPHVSAPTVLVTRSKKI